jgi:hypothetical protein
VPSIVAPCAISSDQACQKEFLLNFGATSPIFATPHVTCLRQAKASVVAVHPLLIMSL